MKKLLLLLITLTTLTNVSYASFPVVASLKNKLSENIPIEIISRPDPAHKIVMGIIKVLVLIIGAFALYNIYRFYRYLFRVVRNSYGFWPKFFAIFGLLLMSTIFVGAIILSIYGGGVGG